MSERLITMPLSDLQKIEVALKLAESHHTAHPTVRAAALDALLLIRRHWRESTPAESEARA